MADLGFLPGRAPPARPAPRSAASGCCSPPRSTTAIDVLVKRFLHQPGHPRGRLGAVADLDDGPPRAARDRRRTGCRCWSTWPARPAAPSCSPAPSTAPRRWPASSTRAACPRSSCTATSARTPAPATWTPSTPARATHAGRHRHRRPRHPRRRRRAGRPRRPAGRAQGLPAPLGPHRPRRRRGHRHHADDRRPGARRARPDPQGRHQPDHHPGHARPTRCCRSSPPVSAPSRAASPCPSPAHPPPGRRRWPRSQGGGQRWPAQRRPGWRPAQRSGRQWQRPASVAAPVRSSARPASGRPASARPASSRPARSAASFSEGASRRSR